MDIDNATQETEQLILALYQQKLMSRARLQEYLAQVAAIEVQMQGCLNDLDLVYEEALTAAMRRPKIVVKGASP
jgi:putative ribosome biogenesis GTPase RsgA